MMLGGRLPPVDAVDVCPDRLRVPSAGAPPSAGRSPHRKRVGPTPPHVRPPPPPSGTLGRTSLGRAARCIIRNEESFYGSTHRTTAHLRVMLREAPGHNAGHRSATTTIPAVRPGLRRTPSSCPPPKRSWSGAGTPRRHEYPSAKATVWWYRARDAALVGTTRRRAINGAARKTTRTRPDGVAACPAEADDSAGGGVFWYLGAGCTRQTVSMARRLWRYGNVSFPNTSSHTPQGKPCERRNPAAFSLELDSGQPYADVSIR